MACHLVRIFRHNLRKKNGIFSILEEKNLTIFVKICGKILILFQFWKKSQILVGVKTLFELVLEYY